MEESKQTKMVFDTLTLLLFLAAFGVAFVFGFLLKQTDGVTPRLSSGVLSAIMLVGFGAVYVMGTGCAFFARYKKNLLTKEFSILTGISTAGLIGIIWLVLVLKVPYFSRSIPAGVDNLGLRIVFILCMLALIAGYGESVFISEQVTKDEDYADEDEEFDNGGDDEDTDDEDSDEDFEEEEENDELDFASMNDEPDKSDK